MGGYGEFTFFRFSFCTDLVGGAEVKHVAILHHVFLSFEAKLSRVPGARLPTGGDIILIGDGFSADKALFEIAVNDARGGRRLGAVCNGPGTGLLRALGKEGDQPQQPVAGPDDPREAGLLEAEGLQELGVTPPATNSNS